MIFGNVAWTLSMLLMGFMPLLNFFVGGVFICWADNIAVSAIGLVRETITISCVIIVSIMLMMMHAGVPQVSLSDCSLSISSLRSTSWSCRGCSSSRNVAKPNRQAAQPTLHDSPSS